MAQGGDQDILQCQSVVDIVAVGQVGDVRFVKSPVEPLAAAVAGKHPSRSIGSMGSRREANYEKVSVGIAKIGDRFAPICPRFKTLAPFLSYFFAPSHEPGAPAALGDVIRVQEIPQTPP